MIIFPAIDLKDGKCVRLYKGDFNKTTIFNSSPFKQSLEFQKNGFTNLHLVDLDAALKGKSKNKRVIIKILKNTKLNVQLGGGIRTLKQISFWIKNGVSTIVVGTMAIQNYKILKKACDLFPGQISVALDARNNFLAVKGWSKKTRIRIFNFLKKIKTLKLNSVIFTDINRDGTKKGLNLIQLKKIIKITNFPVVASGGVASLKDIKKLYFIKGVSGAIIGRAIYDGSINLNELIVLKKKLINAKN